MGFSMASYISVTPIKDPVSVSVVEMGLGTSADALDLREGRCPPVVHVPRTDIDMAPLDRTTRASTCPWKGKASDYSIGTPSGVLENAVWSCEDPLHDMAAIRECLAFYADKVTITRGQRFRGSARPLPAGRSTVAR
ncbi:MAG: hypothetical protein C0524_10330 [Rhodobacter sp.]|nr:hypothetical protein [Rhodobacter sp.]